MTHLQKFIELNRPILIYVNLLDNIPYFIARYVFSKSFHHVTKFTACDMTIAVQVKL